MADALCLRDAGEAALEFARAAPRKAVEKLPEYVSAQGISGPDREGRDAVERMNAALDGGDWEAAVGAGKGLGAAMTSASRVRLVHGRGLALAELGRREASAEAYLARLQRVHHDAGRLAFSHSDWSGALAAWQERLRLAEDLDDMLAISASLQDLGVVHRNLGQPRKALEVFGRAVENEKIVGDRAGVVWTLKNIGIVHGNLREHREALEAYRRALEIQETLDDESELAEILGAIG
ncbi:MAG: tetratricopeptide repeat protein, partial [Planctomycetota bacterium]